MVENSSRTAFLITFFSYNFFIFCFTAQLKNDNIYQHNTFNREVGGTCCTRSEPVGGGANEYI